MIHLATIIRKCHAQKSLNSNLKNGGRRRNVQFVVLKNKIYLFDVQQLLLYEVLGVWNEEHTPGWKERKSVAYCETFFNETMERRESNWPLIASSTYFFWCYKTYAEWNEKSFRHLYQTCCFLPFWIHTVRVETGNIENSTFESNATFNCLSRLK